MRSISHRQQSASAPNSGLSSPAPSRSDRFCVWGPAMVKILKFTVLEFWWCALVESLGPAMVEVSGLALIYAWGLTLVEIWVLTITDDKPWFGCSDLQWFRFEDQPWLTSGDWLWLRSDELPLAMFEWDNNHTGPALSWSLGEVSTNLL